MIKSYQFTWTEDGTQKSELFWNKDHAIERMGTLLDRGITFTFQTITH